jgi:hypothetical protein
VATGVHTRTDLALHANLGVNRSILFWVPSLLTGCWAQCGRCVHQNQAQGSGFCARHDQSRPGPCRPNKGKVRLQAERAEWAHAHSQPACSCSQPAARPCTCLRAPCTLGLLLHGLPLQVSVAGGSCAMLCCLSATCDQPCRASQHAGPLTYHGSQTCMSRCPDCLRPCTCHQHITLSHIHHAVTLPLINDHAGPGTPGGPGGAWRAGTRLLQRGGVAAGGL